MRNIISNKKGENVQVVDNGVTEGTGDEGNGDEENRQTFLAPVLIRSNRSPEKGAAFIKTMITIHDEFVDSYQSEYFSLINNISKDSQCNQTNVVWDRATGD